MVIRAIAVVAFLLGWSQAMPAAAASLDGRAIHYTVTGSGKSIFLIHGWSCDGTVWDGQVAALAKRYRVVVIDLPGHGFSEAARDEPTMAYLALSIEVVRRELRVARAALVGHSMGAAVIRAYADRFPARVALLVAVDGILEPSGMRDSLAPPPVLERVEGKDPRLPFIESMFGPGSPPRVRAKIQGMMLAQPLATARAEMTTGRAWLLENTRTLDKPALAVLTAPGIEFDEARIRQRLPKYREERISDVGHFIMMEKPERFNAVLVQFLSSQDF